MTERILPESEWNKLNGLDGCEIAGAIPFYNHDDVQIVVVEDGDRIVGAWAALRVVQLEGVWIDPEYRKRARNSVAPRLLAAMMKLVRTLTPYWAYTGAQTEEVAGLLTKHLNAKKYPADVYLIPLAELPICR